MVYRRSPPTKTTAAWSRQWTDPALRVKHLRMNARDTCVSTASLRTYTTSHAAVLCGSVWGELPGRNSLYAAQEHGSSHESADRRSHDDPDAATSDGKTRRAGQTRFLVVHAVSLARGVEESHRLSHARESEDLDQRHRWLPHKTPAGVRHRGHQGGFRRVRILLHNEKRERRHHLQRPFPHRIAAKVRPFARERHSCGRSSCQHDRWERAEGVGTAKRTVVRSANHLARREG